jgi:hypothetical protein
MNTTALVVGTGAIVGAGRVVNGKGMSIDIVIGGAALALGIAFLPDILAQRIALLVFVTALFMYVVPIAKKAGLIKKAAK